MMLREKRITRAWQDSPASSDGIESIEEYLQLNVAFQTECKQLTGSDGVEHVDRGPFNLGHLHLTRYL